METTLFDFEPAPNVWSRKKKRIATGAVVLVAIVTAFFVRDWYRVSDEEVRIALVSYSSMSDGDHFGGETVRQQIFPGVAYGRLEEGNQVWFALQPGAEVKRLEGALLDAQRLNVRGVVATTPLSNLRTDVSVTKVYPSGSYQLSGRELAEFIMNRGLYNGYSNVVSSSNRIQYITKNFGTRVAKPGNRSLGKLVVQVLEHERRAYNLSSDAPEVRVAVLHKFVTNEIEYAPEQNLSDGQVIQRPNEVLLQGRANCAGKVVLLASLLEQEGLDYRLAYQEDNWGGAGRLTVLVPRGSFPVEESREDPYPLQFEWQGKKWLIAETTTPNFLIGKTRLEKLPYRFSYIQKPSDGDFVWSVKDGMKKRLGPASSN